MIISTLPTYPGKRIVQDLGIIYVYDDVPFLFGTAVILEDE